MASPNEHILKLAAPTIERPKITRLAGASVVGAIIPETVGVIQFTGSSGETQLHSLRFKRSIWTEEKAKEFVASFPIKGKFEAASGEGGTDRKADCPHCGEIILMAKDDKAEEHLCPTCEAQMKARVIETTTMKGMNLFRAGFWNGRKYGIDFLDKVVENFNAGYMEPYLKITADGSHLPQPPIFRNLSFGWIDRLWREGEGLYADFKDVPTQVEAAIKSGRLKKRSIEIPLNFRTGDGVLRGPVLKSALFFGQGQPLVHGLEDLVEVFNAGDEPGEEPGPDGAPLPRAAVPGTAELPHGQGSGQTRGH